MMIKLCELLHTLRSKEEEGLIPVDRWKATDAMYLEDMGFKNDGMYYYALRKPELRVAYKKNEGFLLEDITKKEKKIFKKFKDLEEYFVNYKQKFENEPYL